MSIYEYDSYKDYLRSEIEQRKKPGLMTALAKSAGCDRNYLSQVLSGKAQLTTDHAVNLSEALELNSSESDYFLQLVIKERSSNQRARLKIEAKLEKLRHDHSLLTERVRSSDRPGELSDESKLRYYKSWKPAAAHILVSIPAHQSAASVAQALSLSEPEALRLLEELCDMGLVLRKGTQFIHRGANIHVPANSALALMNHLNWRMRAMDAASSARGLHYSDVFSISKQDVAVFSALILEFVEKLRKKIKLSGAEEACVFCCDLFSIGT